MTKIVYNDYNGGFDLTPEAILLGRKLSGDPRWGGAALKGDVDVAGRIMTEDRGCPEHPRTDPVLVAVVETLGEAAGGWYARLRISDLPKGTAYRITEHEGIETIELRDEIEWETA